MSKIKKGVLKLPNIIVIGGGASGIVASIIAGRRKAKVTLLERNDRIGKKILVTGNGRCNYTNFDMRLDYFHGSNRNFIDDVLKLFDRDDTLDFFEKLGIMPKIEEGKIFPGLQLRGHGERFASGADHASERPDDHLLRRGGADVHRRALPRGGHPGVSHRHRADAGDPPDRGQTGLPEP